MEPIVLTAHELPELWHIPAEWLLSSPDAALVMEYELRPLVQPDHVVEAGCAFTLMTDDMLQSDPSDEELDRIRESFYRRHVGKAK